MSQYILPKKYCVYCKGQNWKVDTTFDRIDICEDCMKAMDLQAKILKIQKEVEALKQISLVKTNKSEVK